MFSTRSGALRSASGTVDTGTGSAIEIAQAHPPDEEDEMAPGRFAMATVVGGIVLFLVGFLIWGLALAGWMETQVIGPAGMSKETPELVHIFLANLVYAGMLTLVVGSWAGRRSFAGGFSAGLTVGLLFSLSMALMFIGTMNFATPTAHLVDTIATGLWAGVGGGVVAMMLGRGESSA